LIILIITIITTVRACKRNCNIPQRRKQKTQNSGAKAKNTATPDNSPTMSVSASSATVQLDKSSNDLHRTLLRTCLDNMEKTPESPKPMELQTLRGKTQLIQTTQSTQPTQPTQPSHPTPNTSFILTMPTTSNELLSDTQGDINLVEESKKIAADLDEILKDLQNEIALE